MLKILKAYRIPPHLLGEIETTYTNTTSCLVPPFIFMIVLDYSHVNLHEDLGFTITPSKSRRVSTSIHLDVADHTEELLSTGIQPTCAVWTFLEAYDCVPNPVGATV